MGLLEDRFVYCTQWYNHIIDWIHFINDIWKGDSDSLNTFREYLNSVVPSIKFTHEISSASVKFLYTKVMRDSNSNISMDVNHKPTDMHQYLHWMSAHPPHLKHSILHSQALKLKRTCTSTRVSEQRIRVYSEYFDACGYKRSKHNLLVSYNLIIAVTSYQVLLLECCYVGLLQLSKYSPCQWLVEPREDVEFTYKIARLFSSKPLEVE